MDNKKTKLSISGSPKKTFKNLDSSKTQGKKTVIIEKKTGKTESEVIKIMRRSIKPTSFKLWRKRVNQKSIKHKKKFEYSRKEISSKIRKNDYL